MSYRTLAWLPVLAIAWAVGCGREPVTEESSRAEAALLGDLPHLAETRHEGLRAELSRLVDERATPRLLEADDRGELNRLAAEANARSSADHTPDAPPTNRAGSDARGPSPKNGSLLSTLFVLGEFDAMQSGLEELYPLDRFAFTALEVKNAAAFRRQHDSVRTRFRAVLAHPDERLLVDHSQGLMADVSLVDVFEACNRLEALVAAEHLADDRPDEAVEPLLAMFRATAILSTRRHVVPRLGAANQRAEAIRVMEAIAQHPAADRDVLLALREIVAGQLAHWPPDADAWIGDRAMGLHTYEVVRDGRVLSLLSQSEIDKMQRDESLEEFALAVTENVDEDESFYLDSMRRIIAACDQPYFERKDVLDEVRHELNSRRDTSLFPTVAAMLLLEDIDRGHRLQARDRALCEAWLLALSAATGEPLPPLKANPETGERYDVRQSAAFVVVEGVNVGAEEYRPVFVPRRSE
jgi:hypothetical protein